MELKSQRFVRVHEANSSKLFKTMNQWNSMIRDL